MSAVSLLKNNYKKRKFEIKDRLSDFRKIGNCSEKRIFEELCFCICTPQSKAVYCDMAVSELATTGVLFEGGVAGIRKSLAKVRFPNNKARFIVEARSLFMENGKLRMKKHINKKDIFSTREWFVKNVKGIGFKEASHFLRNIGLGASLAILDVHILRQMVALDLMKEMPKTITKKFYYELEHKLDVFSKLTGIPLDELDLLFWSSGTGMIFK